jgi:hypothetical protein
VTDGGLKIAELETWFTATDPLIFKASSPEEMLGLLLARVDGAMDSDWANGGATCHGFEAARSLCGWLRQRGGSLSTPQGWTFSEPPGLVLNKLSMAWWLYTLAATEETLTEELRSALIETSKAFQATHGEIRNLATVLAPDQDISALSEHFVAAAAEMLRHLLAMTRGLVDLYNLRPRPSPTQAS